MNCYCCYCYYYYHYYYYYYYIVISLFNDAVSRTDNFGNVSSTLRSVFRLPVQSLEFYAFFEQRARSGACGEDLPVRPSVSSPAL
jgi:hypothetical protein